MPLLRRKVFRKIHHGRQCQYSKRALFGNETRNLLRLADFSYYVRSLGRSGSGSCPVYTYIVAVPMVWKRMFVRRAFLLLQLLMSPCLGRDTRDDKSINGCNL